MRYAILPVMLSCVACGAARPASSTDACPGDDTGASDDTALVDDTGACCDTADTGDSGPVLPTITVLSPAPDAALFTGTRYDLLARVHDAESATVSAQDAELSCAPLDADGLLHCAFTPTWPGSLSLELTAQGQAVGTQTLSLNVSQAQGVVPRGDRFAMGMYELMDEDWFEPVSAAGFNLVQSYWTSAYTQMEWLGWTAAWGMGAMAEVGTGWDRLYSDAELADLAALPQVAWWELPELPVDDDSCVPQVAALVDRVHALDDRPVYMYLWTTTTQADVQAYLPYLDLVAAGTYPEHACQPQPWIRWRIGTQVQAVADAGYTPEERPVIGLATLFDIDSAMCEPAELPKVRMQALAMIAAGARGVIYFAWYHAVWNLDPEFGALALQTGELIMGESGLGEAVVRGQSLGDLDVVVLSGPEQSEAFTPTYSTEAVQYPSIHAAAWEHVGTRFVVAVNYTDQPVEATIAGLPESTPGVEVVGEDRVLSPVSGTITDSFEPWGAHVYRAPTVE